MAEASDLIVELRERKEALEVAAEDARGLLKERRQLLDSADTIVTFAEEMSEFLKTSELTERRAFIETFVKEVQVKPGRAAIIYSMPTPDDSPIGGADAAEIALNGRVMNSVLSGGAEGTRTPDFLRAKEALSQLSYSPTLASRHAPVRLRSSTSRLRRAWEGLPTPRGLTLTSSIARNCTGG